MKRLLLLALLLTNSAFAADFCVKPGATSKTIDIWVEDESSPGTGKTGLAYNSSSLDCDYRRAGSASATNVTLQASTLGTYTSGSFKEVDSTELPGFYEFGIPDAAIATGAAYVDFYCGGVSDMMAVPFRIALNTACTQLTAADFSFRGVTTSESGTTIGLAAFDVDADDQYTEGTRAQFYDTNGLFYASACIVDSANSDDTITTAWDLSSLHTNGDSYELVPDALCRVFSQITTVPTPGTTFDGASLLRVVYQLFVNKWDSTATEQRWFRNDGSTVWTTKDIADDDTTATKTASEADD